MLSLTPVTFGSSFGQIRLRFLKGLDAAAKVAMLASVLIFFSKVKKARLQRTFVFCSVYRLTFFFRESTTDTRNLRNARGGSAIKRALVAKMRVKQSEAAGDESEE